MIIRKSAREIELMAAAGAVVAETLALLEERLEPGISMIELDRDRRRVHPRARAASDLEGLQGLPGRHLHLAERDDRPRDPERLPRRRGRHHLLRRRRDEGRADRRLGGHLRRRRDLGRGTAPARRLPRGARRRDRGRHRPAPSSGTSPPRSSRSSRTPASRSSAASSATASARPTTRSLRSRTSSPPTAARRCWRG